MDWVVVLWSVSAVITFCLQFLQTQALINGLGTFWTHLGGYLVVRSLIPDGEAMRRTIKVLAAICVIQGVCMINEQISHINVFGLVGGIPAGGDGKRRAHTFIGNVGLSVRRRVRRRFDPFVSLAVDGRKVSDGQRSRDLLGPRPW